MEKQRADLNSCLDSRETRIDRRLWELRRSLDRSFWILLAVLLPMWISIIVTIWLRT